jgi:two-component system nitrate/nitrite response regulator NarL
MSAERRNDRTTVVIVEDHPEFREALAKSIEAAPDLFLQAVCKDLPAALAQLEQGCPDVLLVDLGLPSGSGLCLIRTAHARGQGLCTSAVLTVTGNEEHLLTAATAGAKGCIFKSDHEADWLQVIRRLALGQSPLHAAFAQSLLDLASGPARRSSDGGSKPQERLSTIQDLPLPLDETARRLLRHVAAGYKVEECAVRLGMDADEVGRRVRALYDRLARPVPLLSPRELQLIQHLNQGGTLRQCAEWMGVSESTVKTHAARAYEKLGANNLQSALYAARLAGLIV